eukprot:gene14663-2943_t
MPNQDSTDSVTPEVNAGAAPPQEGGMPSSDENMSTPAPTAGPSTMPTPAPTPDLEEIQEALGDKDLMERSNEITRKLLVSGVSFDVVVKCVKDFQKKYLHIKSTSIEMAAAFTPEMWNATASWNDKDSSDNEEDNSDGGGAAATSTGDDSPSTPRDSEEEDDALMEAFLNATITESSNGTSSDSGSEEDDDDESEDDSDEGVDEDFDEDDLDIDTCGGAPGDGTGEPGFPGCKKLVHMDDTQMLGNTSYCEECYDEYEADFYANEEDGESSAEQGQDGGDSSEDDDSDGGDDDEELSRSQLRAWAAAPANKSAAAALGHVINGNSSNASIVAAMDAVQQGGECPECDGTVDSAWCYRCDKHFCADCEEGGDDDTPQEEWICDACLEEQEEAD